MVRLRGTHMLRQNKGQAVVEFAMVIILFLMFLMTIMDFAIMFFVNQTMQHAVRDGARAAVTGNVNAGSDALTTMTDKIKAQSMGFYDKNITTQQRLVISKQKMGAIGFTNYSGTPVSGGTGAAQDLITVRLNYSWPLLTPFAKLFFTNGKYNFTVKSTVANEPYTN